MIVFFYRAKFFPSCQIGATKFCYASAANSTNIAHEIKTQETGILVTCKVTQTCSMFMERIEMKIGKLKLELCQEEGRKLQRISTRPYLSFLKGYRMLPNKQKQDIDV